ncbi:hypothetical protein [Amycolatopsis cihanbeyliensis]|nr:hypothetical protein [Amycolatopsis cihanbeyliensis]
MSLFMSEGSEFASAAQRSDDVIEQKSETTEPPVIVEDSSYPNADQILAESGVELLKGNGRILFTECVDGADVIRVHSRSVNEFCFSVTAQGGYVTMEVSEVYLIKADSHDLQAILNVKGDIEQVNIDKNEWKSVGEGTDPENGPSTLLEIRTAE